MSDGRWLTKAADAERRALRQALDDVAPFAPSDVRRHRVWVELGRARVHHRLTRRAFAAGAVLASALTAAAFLLAGHWLQRPHAQGGGARVIANAARQAPRPTAGEVAPLVPVAPVVTAKPPLAAANTPAPSSDDALEMLAPGASVKTRAGEHAVRRFMAGARVEVEPASALVIDAVGQPELQIGHARFDVPAQPPNRPFVVRVASYFVVVAGARFSASVDTAGVRVAVESGAVEIWGPGRLVMVAAGASWSHGARAARARVAGARAAPEQPVPARLDGPPADAASSAAADAADLAAARAAAASDPARAIAIYERIGVRGGAAAENAMYQIGSVYRDQLHDPARAVDAWERYRSRYPRGQLRSEADLSIFDALADLGQRSRALDEGLAFLRRHPKSERRGEVARVSADLARVRGQCRLAATLYAEVAGAPVSPDDADDAAFGRASCLDTLDDDDARAALTDYLASYPRGRHAVEARKLLAQP